MSLSLSDAIFYESEYKDRVEKLEKYLDGKYTLHTIPEDTSKWDVTDWVQYIDTKGEWL